MDVLSRDLAVEDLTFDPLPHERMSSSWIAENIDELVGMEAREWTRRSRMLKGPIAGLGFTGVVTPNTEPAASAAAVTGVTVETNLYTPATTTNAAWSLIPIGVLRAPQSLHVYAMGTILSSGASQSCIFNSRIGTSATPSNNAELGATGLITLASTLTSLWWLECHITIRSDGPGGSAVGNTIVQVGQQVAATSPNPSQGVTSVTTGMGGGMVAPIDLTQQQGHVISILPNNSGVSVTMLQYVLLALD